MQNTGQRLLVTLQTLSTEDQDNALQNFLFALFSQKRCGEADKYTFLSYSFLVLYSFTEHGNLRACNSFSQFFSKVVFFARGTMFNHIRAIAKRENKGNFEYVTDFIRWRT